MSVLSNYVPFIRKIPVEPNQRFNRAVKVVKRVSKELVEERYYGAQNSKLNKNDLLSLLVDVNKTLPIEEKMGFDELASQVILYFQNSYRYFVNIYIYSF